MHGTGVYAELLARRFEVAVRRLGLEGGGRRHALDTHRFRPPARTPQLSLDL